MSPHRTKRPWQGQVEKTTAPLGLAYDKDCYLCPGNLRANGERNPDFSSTFVFDNDYAALYPVTEDRVEENDKGLIVGQSMSGICRVICYSPNHSLTLARMDVDGLARVVDCWAEQYDELRKLEHIRAVQVFENRGAMMGASNPHPHCQVWATSEIPDHHEREIARQLQYFKEHGRTLLSDYLELELKKEERLVCSNDSFVALVPYWAVWPFEVMVISRRPVSTISQLTVDERRDLAATLREVAIRYDNLFETDFPYSMGFHQAPAEEGDHSALHLHAHFFPPLLRSATVRKFLVGFEMLAMPQRDITPESAAERLRSVGC